MDISSIAGVILSIASLAIGDVLEGGNPLQLIHFSSIVIIIPTTLFAAMTATKMSYVKSAFKELRLVFFGSKVNLNETIRTLVEFSTIARRDGLLALESRVAQLEDDFLRESLSMVIDGKDIKAIEAEMEIQIEKLEEYYNSSAHYWTLAAESSPTFGLVGAVMGLTLALQKLDNPPEMASGIAGAFTATVTGIVCSYSLFGPFGNKLKANSKDILTEKTIIAEGVIGIADGDNPRNLESRLLSHISPGNPKISQF